MDTRPTTDRIKETLFNILQPQLLDCRFLDLFSGSGGIGIEPGSLLCSVCREKSQSLFLHQGKSFIYKTC